MLRLAYLWPVAAVALFANVAQASDLDGLELGASLEQIRVALSESGEVRTARTPAGWVQLSAGPHTVEFCGDQAWTVTRDLAPSPTTWIRAVKFEADRRGRARGMVATVDDDLGASRMVVEWRQESNTSLALVLEHRDGAPVRVYRRLSVDARCRSSR